LPVFSSALDSDFVIRIAFFAIASIGIQTWSQIVKAREGHKEEGKGWVRGEKYEMHPPTCLYPHR